MKQLLVISVVSIALGMLSLSVVGRLQAQSNSDSLTVNGGVAFINPGIPGAAPRTPSSFTPSSGTRD